MRHHGRVHDRRSRRARPRVRRDDENHLRRGEPLAHPDLECFVTTLHRSVLRFTPRMRDRLDQLASRASTALRCDVLRSAVLRAAIDAWLEANKHADPAQLVETIRASLIHRGRRRQQ